MGMDASIFMCSECSLSALIPSLFFFTGLRKKLVNENSGVCLENNELFLSFEGMRKYSCITVLFE